MNMDSVKTKQRNETVKTSDKSPFKMPKNLSQYRVLEEEMERQERRRQRTLKVHEKGGKAIETGHRVISRYLKEIKDEEEKEALDRMFEVDADDISSQTYKPLKWGYYHVGSRQDFIEKQRQICRDTYFIAEVEKIIQDRKELMIRKEAEMAKAEERVSEDAFLKYVQEETEKTALTLKMIEEGEKEVLELDEEIKSKELEIEQVKKNITKNKELMVLEKQCAEFLWNLSPPEWQMEQEERRQMAEKIRASIMEKEQATQHNLCPGSSSELLSPSNISEESNKLDKTQKEDEGILETLEFYEKPQIYFTDPQQLLDIMNEKENETERLFEELDRLERSLELCKEYERNELVEMKKVNDELYQKVEFLKKSISEKEKIAEELKKKVELFRSSESFQKKAEELQQVTEKIEQVYRSCIGSAPDTLDSREMLKAIGTTLYELVDKFESLPPEKLIQIKRKYKRDKIAKAREEEKLLKVRALQEKRQQRAALKQQRAMAEVQKPTGKKEMYRSQLVKSVRTVKEKKDALDREQDELEKDLLE